MIKFVNGDIFKSEAQTLVNTVNCVGVMGKGLAKEFKDRFPEMNRQYVAACKRGEVRSGHPFLYRDLTRVILCFPTKDNWKGPSKYEFVEAGLDTIAAKYPQWGITSMAIPPLGCGLGGLDWKKVRSLIEKYLGSLPIPIDVYEPGPVGAKLTTPVRKAPVTRVKMTESLALTGELIIRARKRLPASKPLGRLLVQKLAYFAQSAGASLKLKFQKHNFGPYDYNLNHLIERLEGLYVRDISATYARSDLQILDEDSWQRAISELKGQMLASVAALDASIDLLSTADLEEAELLSTTYFAWNALLASGELGTVAEIDDFIQCWSAQKKEKFGPRDIKRAVEYLAERGWMGPPPSEDPSESPRGVLAYFP